ncbi:MAG: DUF493 domain-containing protein [Flavobacteriales bacterium]|nr:DUF493 domain-containing protein [Crocinitomicaceae bacterium]MBO75202.1 DUF493 domain-containing protein [Flavobacteriales bacterium]
MSQHETEAAKRERLREQLNDTHTWPCDFTFKFIVSSDGAGEADLRAIFSDAATFSFRASRNGRYTAFTISDSVMSAEEVFNRYESAAKIPGIISL